MPDILTIGSQIIGAGIGLGLGQYNDQRQLQQQDALNELQNKWDTVASNRDLQDQLELWQATNYPAQVQQMKEAGLNPAMMYKSGGQSGQAIVTGKQTSTNSSQRWGYGNTTNDAINVKQQNDRSTN